MMAPCFVRFCSFAVGFWLFLGSPVDALLRMNDPINTKHTERAEVFLHSDSESNVHDRQKRDARSALPSSLHFSVSSEGGAETHVQLQQHERTHDTIPAYILLDGQVEHLEVDHDSHGVFNHQGKMMQMRPDYDSPEAPTRMKRRGARRSYKRRSRSRRISLHYLLADMGMVGNFTADTVKMKHPPQYNFDASHFSMGDSGLITVDSGGGRQKTGGRVNNIVEACVSVDAVDYKKFLTFARGVASAAVSEVIQWYAFMEIITAAETPWFTNNILGNGLINGNQALNDWGTMGPALFPIADNYIAMTGGDIQGTSSETVGIAVLGGMCSATGSAQVSENSMSAYTAVVLSHEMGHNFNANHDSVSGLGCSDSSQIIMSATLALPSSLALASNPWTFSNCSATVFDTTLNAGSSNCLRMTSCPNSVVDTDQLPGQAIGVDEQCKMFTGNSDSTFCRSVYSFNNLDIEDTMCYRLFCQNTDNSCSGTLALDYTSCGNGKVL
ncbi:hypothetical protein ACOMHN_049496 [Nucella lapillus]